MTHEVIDQTAINADIHKVEDMDQIFAYDIMATPALVINDEVAVTGRVPEHDELKEIITANNV